MIKKIFWLNFLTLIFIALNLRAPITFMSPLLEYIQKYFALNSTLIGLLTSLPLITFGIFAFLVAKLHHIRAMLGSLLCVFFGELIRAYGEELCLLLTITNKSVILSVQTYTLFLGTIIMGGGIAVANVLLPSFIKAKFPRKTSVMMSVYGLTLNVSGILGMLLSLSLMRHFGLINAMGFWSMFALFAIILYIPQVKNARYRRPKASITDSKINIFKSRSAWIIAFFMGTQGYLFFGMVVWLPRIIEGKGYDIDFATHTTIILQLTSIPASFVIPTLLNVVRDKFRNFCMFGICFMYFVGMVMLFCVDSPKMLQVTAVVIGIPLGGVFTIVLVFIAQKSSSVAISVKLSALTQGLGYIVSSLSPLVVGGLYDIFGSFKEAILVFCIDSIIVCILGYMANRARVI